MGNVTVSRYIKVFVIAFWIKIKSVITSKEWCYEVNSYPESLNVLYMYKERIYIYTKLGATSGAGSALHSRSAPEISPSFWWGLPLVFIWRVLLTCLTVGLFSVSNGVVGLFTLRSLNALWYLSPLLYGSDVLTLLWNQYIMKSLFKTL